MGILPLLIFYFIPSNTALDSAQALNNTNSGQWNPVLNHDLAGGVFRVSNDGPKPEEFASPTVDIGGPNIPTEDKIRSHPNFNYLPLLDECGYPGDKPSRLLNTLDVDYEVPVGPQIIGKHSDEEFKRKKRIVGGKAVKGGRHPWAVQLYLVRLSTGEHVFHCGGTIITNMTILTAAHCLTRAQPGTSLDVIVVATSDRRTIQFCKTPNITENCSREVIRVIDDVEVHEEYSEGNLNNDIGLIYLMKPLKFSSKVRPICLPFTTGVLESWTSIKLTATGWGSTNKFVEGFNSAVLKEVDVDLQQRSFCDKFHIRVYGKTLENRICLGGNAGRATCNGDSGGGIFKRTSVKDPENYQEKIERTFQIGIVSAGGHVTDTCGFQGRATIDTNVIFYMEWILNHIVPGVQSYNYFDTGNWLQSEKKDVINYDNEFSTGKKVDVSKHVNLMYLPALEECGRMITPPHPTDRPIELNPIHIGLPMDVSVEELDLKRKKRIVGGIPTGLNNYYPWMTQIYVRNVETHQQALRCSGTIINNQIILTAAHCVTEIIAPFVLDTVKFGQYNRNSTEECVGGACYSFQEAKIADLIVHPEYEKYTHVNNIALIKLTEPIKFTKMIEPICLPRRESLTDGFRTHRYFTAGWGRVLREPISMQFGSDILLQTYVQLRPRKDCDLLYSRALYKLGRARLCGGGKPSRGECNGDGGSPLMKKMETESENVLNNKVFQLGLVAFTDCGLEGMPTVYMNIIYYMDWILDNVVP